MKKIRQRLDIGQPVSFCGQKGLVVCEATAYCSDHELIYDYVLTTKDGLKQPQRFNQKIVSVSLPGSVIERVNDQGKVHFKIDSTQKADEAFLFTQTTPYTAEGHTGWYWMPER